ncbi:ATP-binding protein [Nonomuraea sp. NPDC050022]|uniref:ATP-binding protein n=1 Tax=Nonomuraea sp. NPDC050022 TaxID=3364358 RepID=UPI00379658E5
MSLAHQHGTPTPTSTDLQGGMTLISAASLWRSNKTPREARMALCGWLGQDDPLLLDAQQIVTELISNAVTHVEGGEGRDWVVLRVIRGSGSLRVEVIDAGALDGDGPHVVRQPPTSDPSTCEGLRALTESGRGLHIVKTLSRAWGTYLSGQRRVVWADLPYPSARPSLVRDH